MRAARDGVWGVSCFRDAGEVYRLLGGILEIGLMPPLTPVVPCRELLAERGRPDLAGA